ncbi:MAG: rhodanese-like domain-containing protein [Isosphaeraceae bacterium]
MIPRNWMRGYVGLALLANAASGAQETKPEPETAARLIAPVDLQGRLGKAEVRVLDARPKADYEAGHLPGAVLLDTKAASELAGKPGSLADREAWAAWIKPLGLGPEICEVWIVDGKKQLDAARAWWLLTYLGVERVGLMDGNFGLWAREGRPVMKGATPVEPGDFPVKLRRDRLAMADDVLGALKDHSAKIIDARSLAEHTGERAMSKRGGHIPEACHLEWSDLVDDDGRFLAGSAVKDRLAKLGVKPGEAVITHCQGGGRASVDAFALERLGLSARNYYLGWSDWGNRDETPVVKETPK